MPSAAILTQVLNISLLVQDAMDRLLSKTCPAEASRRLKQSPGETALQRHRSAGDYLQGLWSELAADRSDGYQLVRETTLRF